MMAMPFIRLSFVLTVVAALFMAVPMAALGADGPIVINDITGRDVTLPHPAKRIVLAEGRQVIALALIDPDPIALLAGWLGDFRKNDRQTYDLFKDRFPAIDKVPVLGLSNDGTFSVEQAIALHPDVAVLGVSFAPGARSNDVARQLEAAGIPVVFTDFVLNPLQRTVPSVRIIGQVVGREKEAAAFAAFYERHMKRITDRLARSGNLKKPTILVEAHAGMAECCFAPGRQGIGRLIETAGADSISAAVVPGPSGHLDREYVVSRNPDIYVGTGGAHLDALGGLVIGPGYTKAKILERLRSVSRRTGLAEIKAVQTGNVHGLFHNLLTTPLNILAVENLAKWAHPSLFADLDPGKTESEINRRFLVVPMQGIYWISLNEP